MGFSRIATPERQSGPVMFRQHALTMARIRCPISRPAPVGTAMGSIFATVMQIPAK
jgi:hypothetical protein